MWKFVASCIIDIAAIIFGAIFGLTFLWVAATVSLSLLAGFRWGYNTGMIDATNSMMRAIDSQIKRLINRE